MDEEDSIKELVASTVEGLKEAVKDKDVAVLGVVEFELSVITKKVGKGRFKLVLVEAGANYEKEKISRIKFYIGKKDSVLFKQMGWR